MTKPDELAALPGASIIADDRTIAAIATARGRGALAIVRITGPQTRAVAAALLSPVPQTPRHATRAVVRGGDDDGIVDDVVATLYAAPHSYTGEDLLEISTHGGLIASTLVLAAAIKAGARDAEAGEFTRRAVLNGKLDLIQAEAVADVIEARSSAALRLALRQLDGGLTRRISVLRDQLLAVEALLAYEIDFPEEDDGPVSRERIIEAAEEALEGINCLLATAAKGALVHEGALVVLTGSPNVGKSSLFNALIGEARSIVTEIPGTTRDAIEAVLDLPGWPLRLVDTAGTREPSDLIEKLGIETSQRYLSRASLILWCADGEHTSGRAAEMRELHGARVIIVATKSDLLSKSDQLDADVVVSAMSGAGLSELLSQIEARLVIVAGASSTVDDAPVLTHVRHQTGVSTAAGEMQRFLTGWRDLELPANVAATHVRAAARALAELIGDVRTDDVLDAVFRRFCVGK